MCSPMQERERILEYVFHDMRPGWAADTARHGTDGTMESLMDSFEGDWGNEEHESEYGVH